MQQPMVSDASKLEHERAIRRNLEQKVRTREQKLKEAAITTATLQEKNRKLRDMLSEVAPLEADNRLMRRQLTRTKQSLEDEIKKNESLKGEKIQLRHDLMHSQREAEGIQWDPDIARKEDLWKEERDMLQKQIKSFRDQVIELEENQRKSQQSLTHLRRRERRHAQKRSELEEIKAKSDVQCAFAKDAGRREGMLIAEQAREEMRRLEAAGERSARRARILSPPAGARADVRTLAHARR